MVSFCNAICICSVIHELKTQAFISMLHEGTGVSEFNATQYILGESMEEDISDPYKKHGFNIIVSHQLPSNREVPDTRQNE